MATRHLSLSEVLAEAGLKHLLPLFVKEGAECTLAEMQALLAANRPALLNRLKTLGVSVLQERQQLANALSKAEKAGKIGPSVAVPHLCPPVYEEKEGDPSHLTVTLKIDPAVQSNQVKVTMEANYLSIELCGEPTACSGHLWALVRPKDCTWERERSPRPEYDPLAAEADQPRAEPDRIVVSLAKASAEPARLSAFWAANGSAPPLGPSVSSSSRL